MWIVIACLAVGDLVVLALWLRERRQHRLSRNALRVWRAAAAGTAVVPLDSVDRDMAEQISQLRARARRPEANRIRLATPTGGAA